MDGDVLRVIGYLIMSIKLMKTQLYTVKSRSSCKHLASLSEVIFVFNGELKLKFAFI